MTTPDPTEQLADRLELHFAELADALRTSKGGVRDRGARPVPIEAGVRKRLKSTGGTLCGFSLRETSGTTAALVHLRDGGSSGDLVSTVALSAGESARDWYGPDGISLYHGLYLDVASGAVDGVVFLGGGT